VIVLDENQVVKAVCKYLERDGYSILEFRSTIQKGVDIVAKNKRNGSIIAIEAKGGTSSRNGSARYGRPYSATQVFDRVAKGVYTAMLHLCERPNQCKQVGLAFPDTWTFRKYLEPLLPLFAKLQIAVFLVSASESVCRLN